MDAANDTLLKESRAYQAFSGEDPNSKGAPPIRTWTTAACVCVCVCVWGGGAALTAAWRVRGGVARHGATSRHPALPAL